MTENTGYVVVPEWQLREVCAIAQTAYTVFDLNDAEIRAVLEQAQRVEPDEQWDDVVMSWRRVPVDTEEP